MQRGEGTLICAVLVSSEVCSFALSRLHRGVDTIDDMMADIMEQHEMAQEISDTISRPIGPGYDFDEVKPSTAFRVLTNLFSSWALKFLTFRLLKGRDCALFLHV